MTKTFHNLLFIFLFKIVFTLSIHKYCQLAFLSKYLVDTILLRRIYFVDVSSPIASIAFANLLKTKTISLLNVLQKASF